MTDQINKSKEIIPTGCAPQTDSTDMVDKVDKHDLYPLPQLYPTSPGSAPPSHKQADPVLVSSFGEKQTEPPPTSAPSSHPTSSFLCGPSGSNEPCMSTPLLSKLPKNPPRRVIKSYESYTIKTPAFLDLFRDHTSFDKRQLFSMFRTNTSPSFDPIEQHEHDLLRDDSTPVRKTSAMSFYLLVMSVVAILEVALSYTFRDTVDEKAKSSQRKCQAWCSPVSLDALPHTYVGMALFLLLSFRANVTYNKYYEARTSWATIFTTTRSILYFLQNFLPQDAIPDARLKQGLSYLMAFPILLKHYLRNSTQALVLAELHRDVPLLSTEESEHIVVSRTMPLEVLRRFLAIVKDLNAVRAMEAPVTATVLNWTSTLIGQVSACEKIVTTPLPPVYTTHLRVFLGIYLLFLPLALVRNMGWYTIPTATVVAYGLVGIEIMSVELEDPFGKDPNDLKEDAYTASIVHEITDDIYRIQD